MTLGCSIYNFDQKIQKNEQYNRVPKWSQGNIPLLHLKKKGKHKSAERFYYALIAAYDDFLKTLQRKQLDTCTTPWESSMLHSDLEGSNTK